MAKYAEPEGAKVVAYLKRCEGGSAAFSDIVNYTGIKKEILPTVLKSLNSQGILERLKSLSGSEGKSWNIYTLCNRRGTQGGSAHKNTHGHHLKAAPRIGKDKLDEQILQQLSLGPKTAINIAKQLGFDNKKSVNPALYNLEKEKLVTSETKQGLKPVWCLAGKAAEVSDMFRNSAKDSSAPGAYSPKRPSQFTERPPWKSPNQPFPNSVESSFYRPRTSQPILNQWGQPNNCRPGFMPSLGGRLHFSTPHGQLPRFQDPGQIYRGSQQSRPSRRRGGRGLRRGYGGSRGQFKDEWEDSSQKNKLESDCSSVKEKGQPLDCSSGLKASRPITAGAASASNNDDQEQVPMDNDHAGEMSSTSTSDPAANDDADNSTEEMEDEDYEYDGGEEDYQGISNFGSNRFYDMGWDNLMFSDMTFVDEEEEGARLEGGLSLEDIILVRIGLEQNQSISSGQLARTLGKEEDEVNHILKECEDKVKLADGIWSLTEAGSRLVQDKLSAVPDLRDELLRPHHEWDQSFSGSPVSQTLTSLMKHPSFYSSLPGNKTPSPQTPMKSQQSSSSHLGPPPSPMQLIKTNPVFGANAQGSSIPSGPGAPGRGFNIGEGRNDNSRLGNFFIGGAYDVRELEASAESTPAGSPSKIFLPSSTHSPTPSKDLFGYSHSLTSLASNESNEMDNAFCDNHIRWQALSSQTKPAASTLTSSQHSAQLSAAASMSLPSNQSPYLSMPSLHICPELQKYTKEGLTVVPAASSGQRTGSLLPHHILTPAELVQREKGIAGWTSAEEGEMQEDINSSSLDYNYDTSSMHRSKSLPLIGESAGPPLQITSESFAALNKNPISALMEYAQSRRMQAIIEVVNQRGPSHRPVFVMAAKVGNRLFPGVTCHNKKDGRKEAADLALRTLIAEGQYSASTPTPSVSIAPEDMTHFDKVAALTHQTFNSLIASIPENLAGRKVIAGLVMKRSTDDVGVVISIGTGNRCITGDKLSLEGNTVNDSHAEIITRRGFMRFLYQQLLQYQKGRAHNLFEVGNSGKLRVKDDITFHLYISTAPCGDGALFSPRDTESNVGKLPDLDRRDHRPTFTSNVQGLLRTKMEGGEGTIPVETKNITVQTWDGVVRGERLRTMSCTDKICRWNVLGLQGALLSHFLEPVYLDSLTLGFLYDHGHLARAVCCRLNREEPPLDSMLPSGYHLNHPWLGRVTACQPLRETQKTKALSINWTVGDDKPEVLDGTSGHCYTGLEKQLFSRLAKRSLYESFKQVSQHLGFVDPTTASSYRSNKMAAIEFQAAKTALMNKFQQLGCGWVKKPVEEEMFS